MMLQPQDVQNYDLAMELRRRADRWTKLREEAALPIGAAMVAFGPNWPLAAATAVAGISDYYDGLDGRKSNELLGIPSDNEKSEKDHRADKKLTYSLLGATLVRDLVERHWVSAGFVGTTIGALAIRDKKQAALRGQANREQKSVSAIEINRKKTVVLLGACIVGVSPLGKSKVGRFTRNIGLAVGTGMGIKGYFDFKKHLRDAEPKMELAYTNQELF